LHNITLIFTAVGDLLEEVSDLSEAYESVMGSATLGRNKVELPMILDGTTVWAASKQPASSLAHS
jgi:hypothetical protein